ncbi:hypothetical protein DFQ27_007277 [Actinomortierella ambigua]|uniref:Phosphatidylcholine transfer protein n=1 Tax=Actinomortierella ambigua TaxID=1343610 RepID=A0A9P6TZV0_9FUNG|nr:hypothetical protein DFQ26_008671 [Actinomortierella ambigua]KAG0253671.1 hypothetical protein DFQ27_007277 [Actinomortierella ambigua]
MPFSEDQVKASLDELKTPDLTNWQSFAEGNGFKVFRKPVPGSALFEYKAIGGFTDVPPRYFMRAYTDLEFRQTWDKYMGGWKTLGDKKDRFHYVSKFPWPLSNRDYVYDLRVQEFQEGKVIYMNGHSVEDKACPAKSGTVRVDQYRQDLVVTPTEDGNGCNIVFFYWDDPKGNIPTSVVNWAAKSGIPGFLSSLRDAGISLMKKDAAEKVDEKRVGLDKDASSTPVPGTVCG